MKAEHRRAPLLSRAPFSSTSRTTEWGPASSISRPQRYSGVAYAAVSHRRRGTSMRSRTTTRHSRGKARVHDLARLRHPPHRHVHEPALAAPGVSLQMRSSSGVSTGPGQSAFTRTPCRANCTPSSLAHREDRALRRPCTGSEISPADERDERRDVVHGAAPTLQQLQDAILAAEEHAAGVHRLHTLHASSRSRGSSRRRGRSRRCCRARRCRRNALPRRDTSPARSRDRQRRPGLRAHRCSRQRSSPPRRSRRRRRPSHLLR